MSDLSRALAGLRALETPAPQPPVPASGSPRPTSAHPTPAPPSRCLSAQQQAVVEDPSHRLDVVALAGTGKTTVLMAYATARPRARWRYLTFSRALADRACKDAPRNVRASTFHALAHPRFGAPLGTKLHQRFSAQAVRRAADWPEFPGWESAVAALRAWRAGFLASADALPALAQLPTQAWAWLVARPGILEAVGGATGFIVAAEKLWAATIDPRATDVDAPGEVPVKLMALAGMDFGADGLLIDEAQDLTPALAAALAAQRAPVLAVGDPGQALYDWRGPAGWEPSATARALTGSWRFGPDVASVANPVLATLGRSERLEGLREDSAVAIASGLPLPGTTVLARTQAGALAAALAAAEQGLDPRWVGAGTLGRLASLVDLAQGRPSRDPWLAGMGSVREVAATAAAAADGQWRASARLVAAHDPAHLERLLRQLRQDTPGTLSVSTVHQAKGRTFPRVRLAQDLDVADPDLAERRVHYVALTRAAHLELPEATQAALDAVAQAPVAPIAAPEEGF